MKAGKLTREQRFTAAVEQLHLHLNDLADAGILPMCITSPDAPLWTSEQAEERERVAPLCHGCPALTKCNAAGELASWGIWAGIERSRKTTTNIKRSNKA